jgi:hypothetical protein
MKYSLSKLALAVVFLATGATAQAATIYDSIPAPMPGSSPSLGYQATQTNEFGDHVEFTGTERALTSVDVLLNSWACQQGGWNTNDCANPDANSTGYDHPVTFKIYAVDTSGAIPVVGGVIASRTQTVHVPWRPASDPACTGGGYGASCSNGFNFVATFDFTGMNVVLPNAVVYGVEYNTQTYGPSPLGADGPYNSLNFSVPATGATVGNDVNTDAVFWNTNTAAWYSDGGAGGTGTLRQDTNWTGNVPAVRFNADMVVVDEDEDGVEDGDDRCPTGGVAPDAFTAWEGSQGRYMWNGSKWVATKKGAKGFTPSMEYTYGCTGRQILDAMSDATGLDFGGHYKFGLSKSILEDWHRGTYHVGRTFVETVTVPATSETSVSSIATLESGTDYFLKAYGTADAGDGITFDADYSFRVPTSLTWTDAVSTYESYGDTLLDLYVDGVSFNWGLYAASHEYEVTYPGTGDKLELLINDVYHVNNVGSLSVDIIEDKWVDLW